MFAWLKELDGRERKTLIAAVGGWATDSVDVMVFIYVVPTLIAVWGMTKIQAGWITTATVISSAIGGWLAGVLADRFGRVRILQLSIAWFAFFTFLCGFTNSFEQLLVTRSLQGLGIDKQVDQRIEGAHRVDVAHAGPLQAQRFGVAIAAFRTSTLAIDALVKRTLAI